MLNPDRWQSDPIVQHALSRLAATRDYLIASPDPNTITTNLERESQALECGVAFLRHAATLEGAQRVAGRLKDGTVLECQVEVAEWNRMFRLLKSSGSRTPSATGSPPPWGPGPLMPRHLEPPSRTPSPTGTPEPAEKVGARNQAVCEQCGSRDRYRCVVTGIGYDTLAKGDLSKQAFQEWDADIVSVGMCHVTHLLPFCMMKEKYHPVLDYFESLSGISLCSFKNGDEESGIDSLQNVMILSHGMRHLKERFFMVFRLTETEHVYKVEFDSEGQRYGEVSHFFGRVAPTTLVRFDTTPNGLNPPSSEVLKLYESLYDIAHASPGTEALLLPVLRLEPQEWEEDVQDGLDGEETLNILQSKLEWVEHAQGRSLGV